MAVLLALAANIAPAQSPMDRAMRAGEAANQRNARALKDLQDANRELQSLASGKCSVPARLMDDWVAAAREAAALAPTFYGGQPDDAELKRDMLIILRGDADDFKTGSPADLLRRQESNARTARELVARYQGNLRTLKVAEHKAELIRLQVATCLAGGGVLDDPSPGFVVGRNVRSTSLVMGKYVGRSWLGWQTKCIELLSLPPGVPMQGDIGWHAQISLLNSCGQEAVVWLRNRDGSIQEVKVPAKDASQVSCIRCDVFVYHVVSEGDSAPPTSVQTSSSKTNCRAEITKLNQMAKDRGSAPAGTPTLVLMKDALWLVETYLKLIEKCPGEPEHRDVQAYKQQHASIMRTCVATIVDPSQCVAARGWGAPGAMN